MSMTPERAITRLQSVREDNLEILSNLPSMIRDRSATRGYVEALDLAIEALNAQRWVPVSEQMPENDSHKLYAERTVYNVVVYGNVSAAVYGSKVRENVYDWWVDRRGYVVEGVTHWQPAPLPPVEV